MLENIDECIDEYHTINKPLKHRFEMGLIELGHNPEEVRKTWKNLYSKEDLERHTHLDTPPFSNRCICGHRIYNQCYIYSPDEKYVEVVGSDCINKFILGTPKKMICDLCGEPTRKNKNKLCKSCKNIKTKNCPCCEDRPCLINNRRCIKCQKRVDMSWLFAL